MKNLANQFNYLFLGLALFLVSCGQDKTTTEETTTTTTTTTEETDTMVGGPQQDTTVMGGGMMKGMMGHMHQHMQDMQEMKPQMTGDPDYDFALMMTRHHQGGIQLAEEEVANGTDTKLKEIANGIIKTNKADIEKLQNFTKSHKIAKGDTATTMRMMHPMRKMMADMHKQDMSNMNADQSFAQMMIHHHEMGNEMSREVQKQGKTQEMKQMAQKIITEQEKDLKELKAWQQQNKM